MTDQFTPATSFLVVACVGRSRYFDLDAVREPHQDHHRQRTGYLDPKGPAALGRSEREAAAAMTYNNGNPAGAPPLDYWEIPTADVFPGFDPPAPQPPKSGTHRRTAKGVESVERSGKSADRGGNWSSMRELAETAPAPPLDWWQIPTAPYPGAHYATWPEALLVKPIKAMCPERVCRVCGKPSERITSAPEYVSLRGAESRAMSEGDRRAEGVNQWNAPDGSNGSGWARTTETLGWSDCGCSPDGSHWRRGLVLDPFAGSGTTLAVAVGHGRDAIGIDLDARNADLARQRVGMFLEVEGEPTEPAPPHGHNPTGNPRYRVGYQHGNPDAAGDKRDYGAPESPYLSERPTVDVPPSQEIA